MFNNGVNDTRDSIYRYYLYICVWIVIFNLLCIYEYEYVGICDIVYKVKDLSNGNELSDTET